MPGEFGSYINAKRKGRGKDGSDVLLRDLAEAMGNMSASYLSDIIKGRRNPPDKKLLEVMADVLSFTPDEKPRCMTLQEEKETKPPQTSRNTSWTKKSLM